MQIEYEWDRGEEMLKGGEGRERTLGRDQPGTLTTANNLRVLLKAMECEVELRGWDGRGGGTDELLKNN